MPAPLHNITITVSGNKTVTVPVRCKIVYPFAIHRRMKQRGEKWIIDNAPNTRGYVITHLLTGNSVTTIRPRWSGGTMIECKHRLISLAEKLSSFPDFLMSDTRSVVSGPNKKTIAEIVSSVKPWG
jgi:hypothetical protein